MNKWENCGNYHEAFKSCYKGRDCDICPYYDPIRRSELQPFLMNCDKCGRVFDRYKEEYEIHDDIDGKVYYCKSCGDRLRKIFKTIENSDLRKLEEGD